MLPGPAQRDLNGWHLNPYAFRLAICKQLLLFTPETGYLLEMD